MRYRNVVGYGDAIMYSITRIPNILIHRQILPTKLKSPSATALVVTIQSLTAAVACVTASKVLYSGLLYRIMRAPMAFFDTTPSGRILNRFSQDVNVMDTSIRMNLANVFRGVTSLVTTCLAISYSTPVFVVALVPIAICYYFLQARCGEHNREQAIICPVKCGMKLLIHSQIQRLHNY